MATQTSNYNLVKQAQDEFYNVDIPNGNMDIIDAQLKANADDAAAKIPKSLATAADQVPVSSGVGAWAVKTLAQFKTWLGLGAAAYAAIVNNLTTTATGSVLDASQGKALSDLISNEAVEREANDTALQAVATQTVKGLMSATDKTKLDGVAANANNYAHPTTAGNKHVPAGGAADNILGYSADGTAIWIQQLAAKSLLAAATQTLFGGATNVDAALVLLINSLAKKSYIWGVTPSDTVIASLSNVTAGVSYSQLVKQFYVKHGGKYRVKGTISAAGTVVLSTTTNADTDESNPANSYLSAVFSAASAGAFTLDMTIAVPPSSIIRIWYDPAASGNTLTNLTVCGTLSAVSNADVMEVISV